MSHKKDETYQRMKTDPQLHRLYEFKLDIKQNSMPVLKEYLESKTFEMLWPPKVQALLDHADWCIQTYIKSTYNTNPIND